MGAICASCLEFWLGILGSNRWSGRLARGRCDFCNDRRHAKDILQIKAFQICVDCMRAAHGVLRKRGLAEEEFPDIPRAPEPDSELAIKALRKQQAAFQEVVQNLVSLLARVRGMRATGKAELIHFAETPVVKLAYELLPGLGYDDYDSIEKSLRKVVSHVDQIITGAEAELSKPGYFSELWENETFVKLAEIGGLFNRAKDVRGRRFRRILRLAHGSTGEAVKRLFKNEEDYKEFERWVAEQESAISMYTKGLKDEPAEIILARLEKEPVNHHSVIASLHALAALGELDWRERRIWRALERAQEQVLFDEEIGLSDPRVWNDDLQSQIGRQLVLKPAKEAIVQFEEADSLDTVRLQVKMQRALDIVWPPAELRWLEEENTRKIRGRKGIFEEEAFERSQYLPQWLGLILLEAWHGGWKTTGRYEAYLGGLLSRSGTKPELAFAFLILGHCFGLLDPDAVSRLCKENSWTGRLPPGEWIAEDHEKRQAMNELAADLREGRVSFLFLDTYLADQTA